jgi:hypothetical protein
LLLSGCFGGDILFGWMDDFIPGFFKYLLDRLDQTIYIFFSGRKQFFLFGIQLAWYFFQHQGQAFFDHGQRGTDDMRYHAHQVIFDNFQLIS